MAEVKPMARWYCERCWKRFGKPVSLSPALCDDCHDGQTFFGAESQIPKGNVPLGRNIDM